MVAGGTGITPMLNVIMHHIQYGNNKNKILLLWFNRTYHDLFCEEFLEYIVKKIYASFRR